MSYGTVALLTEKQKKTAIIILKTCLHHHVFVLSVFLSIFVTESTSLYISSKSNTNLLYSSSRYDTLLLFIHKHKRYIYLFSFILVLLINFFVPLLNVCAYPRNVSFKWLLDQVIIGIFLLVSQSPEHIYADI